VRPFVTKLVFSALSRIFFLVWNSHHGTILGPRTISFSASAPATPDSVDKGSVASDKNHRQCAAFA
jgi:hypothetical protein